MTTSNDLQGMFNRVYSVVIYSRALSALVALLCFLPGLLVYLWGQSLHETIHYWTIPEVGILFLAITFQGTGVAFFMNSVLGVLREDYSKSKRSDEAEVVIEKPKRTHFELGDDGEIIEESAVDDFE